MKRLYIASSDFSACWDRLCRKICAHDALYQPLNLRFYNAYHHFLFSDHSIVITFDDEEIGGLRVTSHIDAHGVTVFSCYGLPIIYVEAANLNISTSKRLYSELKSYINQLSQLYYPCRWIYGEQLNAGRVTELGRHFLALGGLPEIVTTQIIDLFQDEQILFNALTKSFKWSVNWGIKNLDLRLIHGDTIQPDDIQLFKQLHIDASGRETRNHSTWDAQYQMIKGGEAFLCFGNLDNRLATAALFCYSSDHCYYGVSASRRELFSNTTPLSHVLVWRAITYARLLGCRWFEMGDLRFPYQVPSPSKKEQSISTFKKNFGGKTFVKLKISLSLSHD